MGYEGISSGALLDDTFSILKVASQVETLDELTEKSCSVLSYKSNSTKKKYFNVVKDRFLQFTEEGKILRTPLLDVINLPIDEKIKREIVFYHLSKVESIILQILYYIYNFLPQKKEISKANYKSSVYLLMDKESNAMLNNLNEILEVFNLIKINKKQQTIEFDYYPVSWQAFVYALYHHYTECRDKKKVNLSMTDVFDSALPRIFLMNLQHMQKILSAAEDFWLIRPAGKGFQNNFLLMSSLDRVIQAF